MATRPLVTEIPGADAPLGALHWPARHDVENPRTVLAVHGITANAWHFDPLAHRLGGDIDLVAVDLRGRGRSFGHAGPFGIRQHAADIAAASRALPGPVTVVGHSMGAYVALMSAETDPGVVDDLILVDGGAPLPGIEPGQDPDEVLAATLGPALSRLRTPWPDRVSYETMWAAHPAFADGIGIDLERNLLADLVETETGLRVAVSESAVVVDGRDLLVDEEVRSLLAIRDTPTVVLRATGGLNGAPPPLIPTEAISEYDHHLWQTVEGTNHYTILLGPTGAEAVAESIRNVTSTGSRL